MSYTMGWFKMWKNNFDWKVIRYRCYRYSIFVKLWFKRQHEPKFDTCTCKFNATKEEANAIAFWLSISNAAYISLESSNPSAWRVPRSKPTSTSIQSRSEIDPNVYRDPFISDSVSQSSGNLGGASSRSRQNCTAISLWKSRQLCSMRPSHSSFTHERLPRSLTVIVCK